ncbi:26S proteasome regulatory subunit 8, partial [Basidiobolus ranarum]
MGREGIKSFYKAKIEECELTINEKTQNLRRLEAQRNALNTKVRLLREELQLLQEPGSYVGEVVKLMGKKKALVKIHPEGKYVVDIDADIDIAQVTPTTRVALRNLLISRQISLACSPWPPRRILGWKGVGTGALLVGENDIFSNFSRIIQE